ncbi:MAG: hypothetical protein QOG68_115 [Solirubrobacteraceae bacterium]|jgi:hypothetical protein|nr:hypothetical protein [Solirubrobacteraceae bacterium]
MDSEHHPHVCGSCASHLVQEVERERLSTRYWSLTLRCPECSWAGTGVFDDETVARFDDVVADAFDQLAVLGGMLAEAAL